MWVDEDDDDEVTLPLKSKPTAGKKKKNVKKVFTPVDKARTCVSCISTLLATMYRFTKSPFMPCDLLFAPKNSENSSVAKRKSNSGTWFLSEA